MSKERDRDDNTSMDDGRLAGDGSGWRQFWLDILLLVCAVVAGILLAAAALQLSHTDDDNDDGRQMFRIQPQQLDSALTQVAVQTDCELLMAADIVKGMEHKGLFGSYTVDEAMATLLAGTGLVHKRIAGSVLLVIDPKRPSNAWK